MVSYYFTKIDLVIARPTGWDEQPFGPKKTGSQKQGIHFLNSLAQLEEDISRAETACGCWNYNTSTW